MLTTLVFSLEGVVALHLSVWHRRSVVTVAAGVGLKSMNAIALSGGGGELTWISILNWDNDDDGVDDDDDDLRAVFR